MRERDKIGRCKKKTDGEEGVGGRKREEEI